MHQFRGIVRVVCLGEILPDGEAGKGTGTLLFIFPQNSLKGSHTHTKKSLVFVVVEPPIL